jgi:hypothetical protein
MGLRTRGCVRLRGSIMCGHCWNTPRVSLSGRGGHLVELRPSMLDAFDRFVAAAMSGHNLLYKLARERMAKEQRRPDS